MKLAGVSIGGAGGIYERKFVVCALGGAYLTVRSFLKAMADWSLEKGDHLFSTRDEGAV